MENRPPNHRILGHTYRQQDSDVPDDTCRQVFAKWLDRNLCQIPSASDPARQDSTPMVSDCAPIYGCHYSLNWHSLPPACPIEHSTDFDTMNDDQMKLGYDIAISIGKDASRNCALEIFSIFILKLASRIESLKEKGIIRKKQESNDPSSMVEDEASHPDMDKLAECLVEAAPKLLPNVAEAKLYIIPAFLYHDILH